MPRHASIAAPVLGLCLLADAPASLAAQPAASPPSPHGPDRPRVDDTTIADPGGGYGALAGRPRVRATRTDTPPEIDGRLDDEVWRTAAMISEFVQQSPLDGAPATERTEAWIAYDRDHLYFGFYLHYADPSMMWASLVDRDTAMEEDLITVYIDTFMDQQRCYDFDVNAYNVQGDGVIRSGETEGGAIPHADRSWDSLFHSGAQIVEDGYTAEMAIPFKSFRYPPQPPGVEHRWGLQILREIRGKDEENAVWAPMSRDVLSFMAQMGVLEGMTDLSTSRNLEFLPSFTAIGHGSLDRQTGAFVGRGADREVGLNVKYGITSNLTADFTFNPDFSQIESDVPQIEVNQRFPVFFPELRPFFLEGADIFEFNSPVDLVHTRTLVDPNLGAKLTGKVGNMTLGVVVTDDEAPGRRDDPDERGYGENARVLIGRARYDLYTESHIGTLVTDREFLDGHSRVAAVDGQFRLGRASRFNFVAARSQHRDEQGVEREGPMVGAYLRHEGRHLQASAFAARIDPDFRTDVGFVERVDQQAAGATVAYRWWPESWIINWGPSLDYQRSYRHDGILEDEIADAALEIDFSRNISVDVNVIQAHEWFGGIDFSRRNYEFTIGVDTSHLFTLRTSFRWGDQIYYIDRQNPYLGRGSSVKLSAVLRPFVRFTSQIDLVTSRFFDVRAAARREVFDVQVLRALSTFAFTNRMLLRNITEYDSFRRTMGTNLLLTYRINALTVFYFGYDDHFQREDVIDVHDRRFFQSTDFRRTNRALFTKLRVLLRY